MIFHFIFRLIEKDKSSSQVEKRPVKGIPQTEGVLRFLEISSQYFLEHPKNFVLLEIASSFMSFEDKN